MKYTKKFRKLIKCLEINQKIHRDQDQIEEAKSILQSLHSQETRIITAEKILENMKKGGSIVEVDLLKDIEITVKNLIRFLLQGFLNKPQKMSLEKFLIIMCLYPK